MENISNVFITDCKESHYLKPLRIHYTQNGKQKMWDVMKVHNSVAILVYNISRDVLVFVKQFRPAVYYCSVQKEESQDDANQTIDTSKFPASHGITYELCAGIIDKDMSFQETAQAEVLEECGYKVPLEKFQRITSFRAGVGTTGALQELYYVEVTDDQRVSKGGGIVEEGELIDVVEVPVDQGKNLVMDETIQKPAAFLFALMWFYENIRKASQ
ncbi:hypothetical protein ACJMK2_037774 [Sinanodonta woodiana]|uniref:Uridine diphosphate glucose pyrophosphatase NUDT14 n=1 Tax=Sinanodonta woodiana TaxID=1069815 RepID=A0ABD3WNC5_SINWO